MTVSFDPDSPVPVYPLTYLDEGDEVTVGRTDTGSFAVLPADGAALLRQLASGMSLRQSKRWYAEQYGEDVDIDEFLAVLDELELLGPQGDVTAEPEPAPVRWQGLGRALFSPVSWVGYGVLVVAAIVAMVRQPDLVPQYRNLFFTRYLVPLELGIYAGQLPVRERGVAALAGVPAAQSAQPVGQFADGLDRVRVGGGKLDEGSLFRLIGHPRPRRPGPHPVRSG